MGKERKKGSFRGAAWVGAPALVLALGAGGVAVAEQRTEPVVHPGVVAQAPKGSVDLSGMTWDDAAAAIEAAWKPALNAPLKFRSSELKQAPEPMAPVALGAVLDVDATLASVEFDGFLRQNLPLGERPTAPPVVLVLRVREDAEGVVELAEQTADFGRSSSPAKARFVSGGIVTEPEKSGYVLDEAKLGESLTATLLAGEAEMPLPLKSATKMVSDEDLAKITEVMAQFSTNFNAGKRSRTENIRLAAKLIDGTVILPGEKFSFNGHIGRRTRASGFQVAGVYVNGTTAEDVGGGICQVSTTLYNAALLSALDIPVRSSHSLPVPYVPLGRDAAVSFPNPDLVVENTYDFPIALAATVSGGTITFRVLGQKHDYDIDIIRGSVRSASNGVKKVVDSSLGYGVEKVVTSGASRQSLTTWRVLKKDGVEVRRDELGTSIYRGSPRIIAHNPNAKKPEAPAAPTAPVTPPAQPVDNPGE